MATKGNGVRRRWVKRQREWLYLEHFLAVQALRPSRIIEGQDDGHEPDFTLLINGRWIGIELTTLPRLRDQIGEHQLRMRRLYWWLMRQLGWPLAGARATTEVVNGAQALPIGQADIDAVMQKKHHRVPHYRQRRHLDELWLLIHTDAMQADGLLAVGATPLHHGSAFDRVWLSRYPLRTLIDIDPGDVPPAAP